MPGEDTLDIDIDTIRKARSAGLDLFPRPSKSTRGDWKLINFDFATFVAEYAPLKLAAGVHCRI